MIIYSYYNPRFLLDARPLFEDRSATNGGRTDHVRKDRIMSDEKINQTLDELSKPFHPSRITWRPGALTGKKDKALALAYADLRAYQNRLDETCGMDWSVSYTPWGDRIICHLTINGITRSSTGEADSDSERSEIAGTSAEAQAFKRACAMFGLGRYLYSLPTLWVEYDAPNQRFTEKSKARLHSIIAQHYQRFLNGGDPRGAASTLDAPAEESPEDVQAFGELSRAVAEPVRATEETTSTEPVRQAQGEPARQGDSQPAQQAQREPARPAATKSLPKQVKVAPAPTNGVANGTVNGSANGSANGNGNGNGSHAAENGEPQDEALLPLRKKLDELGKELYGEQWAHVRAHNIKRLVGGQNDGNTALSKEQMQTLINGLKKLQQQRQAA